MRTALVLTAVLAGCASSPEYVASKSDFTVCRFTMGGPHARAADEEARKRGLNCPAMYPAINAQMANENAATQQILRATQPAPAPAPLRCQTVRTGGTLHTDCF